MKETPIVFSSPMVRAILDGRKTQTRRMMKFGKRVPVSEFNSHGVRRFSWVDDIAYAMNESDFLRLCPYGVPGDRLWVREPWGEHPWINADQSESRVVVYKADGETSAFPAKGDRWRPSIRMRRKDSRLTLEILSVRVERLQSISEEVAIAEGAEPYRCPQADALIHAVGGGMKAIPHTSGFANLWESIHGPGSWAANPFVWVIEFKRVPQAVSP